MPLMSESGMYNLQTVILIKLASIFRYPNKSQKAKKNIPGPPHRSSRSSREVTPEAPVNIR